MTFYRIRSDLALGDAWYLKAPTDDSDNEVDARVFTECRTYDAPTSLHVSLRRPGAPVDFTFADFEMPVVSERAAETIAAFSPDALQLLPVTIEPDRHGYMILNVLTSRSCVDEKRSKFTKWTPADGRPEKVGQYRMFSDLVLDASKLEGEHIARVREWMVTLVVSEELKDALQETGTTGIVFDLVA